MRKIRLFAKTPKFPKLPATAKNEPHDVAVKRMILQIAGDFSTEPGSLRESLSLRDNLQYKDNEYSLLQIRLNSYVKTQRKDSLISAEEVNGCNKVGDCIDLVEGKLS